jgi:hypothetical protein
LPSHPLRLMFKRYQVSACVLCCLLVSQFGDCLAETQGDSIAPSYHWGRGINIPQANLNLGGYLNAVGESFNSRKSVGSLDDLSLFITWSPFGRVQFFSELELEDYISTNGLANIGKSFKIERLYADVFISESITARFGKFLTPFGRWNVIHASPLVWTTSRPLVTNEPMLGTHASGIMLSKHFEIDDHDLNVSVYGDDSDDLDPRKSDLAFDQAVGARLNYMLADNFEIGGSYLGFKKSLSFQQSFNHLFGIDLLWKKNNFEVQVEMSYRYGSDNQGDEKGFYLQGVAPLVYKLSAVGRYEFLDGTPLDGLASQGKRITHIGIVGLAWRPYAPLVVKAEYRFGSDNNPGAPSGVMASFAMFF